MLESVNWAEGKVCTEVCECVRRFRAGSDRVPNMCSLSPSTILVFPG